MEESMTEHRKVQNSYIQYYASICCNLISLSFGGSCAWASMNFLVIQSDETPVTAGKLTLAEASWVVSFMTFGGFLGNILFGTLSERYGRKIPLLLAAIPQFFSWLLILWPQNLYYLIMARFLAGLAGGATYVLIPLYTAEISSDRVRGTLGSILTVTCNIGIFLELVLGNYVSYETQAKIFLVMPVVFIIAFLVFPETPAFLLSRNKIEAAEKSLAFYKIENRPLKHWPSLTKFENGVEEMNLQSLQKSNEINTNARKLKLSDFTSYAARKSTLLGIGLILLMQLSGSFVLLNYSVAIFTEAGSNLSPNESSIVMGLIQIIGSYVSLHLVDKAGRRVLLITSAFGAGFGLLVLGLYSYLKSADDSLSTYSWIPLVSLSFVIFIGNCGILSLPFTVIAEIVPENIRNAACSGCMTLMWLLAFLVIRSYPYLAQFIGMHGCMFIYAMCSFAGGVFVMLCLPETKGKSHEMIMEMLTHNNNNNI